MATDEKEEVFEDYLEEIMVKDFREIPGYAKEALQDEFNEYVKTSDIRPLQRVMKCIMKAFGYTTKMANETDLGGETVYYDLTKVESEPKMTAFKSIFNNLGFDFSIIVNSKYVENV
ncbi:hypothetical protein FACS1894152_7530 [Bacilli bacterium]|nr:hypothetical protein FACS1894152_7530 [Bacilli bacterium]